MTTANITTDYAAGTENLLDALPAQIAIVDGIGTIRFNNRAWQHVAERGALASPTDGAWNYLAACRDAAARGCSEANVASEGIAAVLRHSTDQFVMNYPCPFDGRYHWYQLTASPTRFAGEPAAIVMHLDVTTLQSDPLTDLPNRLMFEAQLAYSLAQAERRATKAGLVLLDLDGFKPVNDEWGHPAGDRLLIGVANRLRSLVRDDDLVARLGGDEFAIVPGNVTDATALTELAERLVRSLQAPFAIDGHMVEVGASAGVAWFPTHGADVESLIAAADAALYAAKQAGRGCSRVAEVVDADILMIDD